MDERVFLLAETEGRCEVYTVGTTQIGISCGLLMDLKTAEQLQLGIRAVLSGNFDRACSQELFEFDLARRTRRVDSTTRVPSIKPELDML